MKVTVKKMKILLSKLNDNDIIDINESGISIIRYARLHETTFVQDDQYLYEK